MRAFTDYRRNLPNLHRYLWWFTRALILFRRPFRFLVHYLRRTTPADGSIAMRDGTLIHLSGHAHDVITPFVIFVREDYGRLPCGGTVVDIGANIGAFAVFAARQGAHKVIAFEPNSAAYGCLQRNIAENGLKNVVRPQQLAVTGVAGQRVRFPVAASAYNRIAEEHEQGEYEIVGTTSLAEIIASEALGEVDILKLDCEGAEYDILLASDAPLDRVREIRMEYHCGRGDELVALLTSRGFRITRFEPDGPLTGMLWARQTA